ncbi:MAG: PP2C family serine/threonine-protein phosphatase, partial [Arenimonas sp.]
MGWKVHAAAAIGSSHIEGGIPCQDAYAHASAGGVLVAVVCDGAGSARRSHVGSARFARAIADALAACAVTSGEALCDADPADLSEAVRLAISSERSALRQLADEEGVELSAFAATLVAAIVGPDGGWFLHVGDGIGVAELAADGATVMTLPENGEYSNETYFVTGSEWSEHLRLTR